MAFSETTIGNIPDTLPSITDSTLFESEFNPGPGAQGYKTPAPQFFDYVSSKYTYGDGIDFTSPNLSIAIDTTNLKFNTGLLDTIQDIDTTAFPTFSSLSLNDVLIIDKTTIGNAPSINTTYQQIPTSLPWGTLNITSSGFDSLGSSKVSSQYYSFISDDTPASFSGGSAFNINEEGSLVCYQEFNGNTKTILQNKRAQNLVGYQSFSEQFPLSISQNVDNTLIGRTVLTESASPITLTIPLSASLPLNSEFDVIRSNTGDVNIQAAAGVTINGIDGDSFAINEQWGRIRARQLKEDDWAITLYSGSSSSITDQETYDNSPNPALVVLSSGKTAGYAVGSGEAGWTLPGMSDGQYNALSLPENGELAWTTDDNRITANAGTPVSPNPQKVAYLSDIEAIEEDVVYGEMYFQGNALETVISTINTPVKVNATYSSGDLQEFTFSNGRLTYNGLLTRTMKVTVPLTASMDSVSANVTPYIAKNGSIIVKSKQTPSLAGISPAFSSMVCSALVEFSTGDYVELFIENNNGTDNITVGDLNTFTVNTIGGTSNALNDGLSGNFQIGAATIPTSSYSTSYTSLIQEIDGTQNVSAGSLAVGESVQIKTTFNLNPTIPSFPTVSGEFRYTFGSIVIEPLSNLTITNSASRTGYLEFTVTRINNTEVNIDITGWYVKTSPVEMTPIIGSPALLGSNVYPYNDAIDYFFDIEWRHTVQDASNYLDIVAQNLKIVQFTDRKSSGSGSQVVESYDGSTTPVNLQAGDNIALDPDGTINVTGVVVGAKSHGGYYINNEADPIVIINTNQAEKITAPIATLYDLVDFTYSDGELTYTGVTTKIFKVTLDISAHLADVGENIVRFTIFKNAVVAGPVAKFRIYEANSSSESSSISSLIQMSTGDKVAGYVSNGSSTKNIVVIERSLIATEA